MSAQPQLPENYIIIGDVKYYLVPEKTLLFWQSELEFIKDTIKDILSLG